VLDFQSSGIRHDFWLLAVHRPVAFSRPCLVPATPHPLLISSGRHPTVPAPPKNPFGSHPRAFTPCSARTTTKFLKTPPSLFKVPVIFLFLLTIGCDGFESKIRFRLHKLAYLCAN
jgi:hypothetical protein